MPSFIVWHKRLGQGWSPYLCLLHSLPHRRIWICSCPLDTLCISGEGVWQSGKYKKMLLHLTVRTLHRPIILWTRSPSSAKWRQWCLCRRQPHTAIRKIVCPFICSARICEMPALYQAQFQMLGTQWLARLGKLYFATRAADQHPACLTP